VDGAPGLDDRAGAEEPDPPDHAADHAEGVEVGAPIAEGDDEFHAGEHRPAGADGDEDHGADARGLVLAFPVPPDGAPEEGGEGDAERDLPD
jgi:hypothetical protein